MFSRFVCDLCYYFLRSCFSRLTCWCSFSRMFSRTLKFLVCQYMMSLTLLNKTVGMINMLTIVADSFLWWNSNNNFIRQSILIRIISTNKLLWDMLLRTHYSWISILCFRLERTWFLACFLNAWDKRVDWGVFWRWKNDVCVELMHQTVFVVFENQVILVFITVRTSPNFHFCLENISVEVSFEIVRMSIIS